MKIKSIDNVCSTSDVIHNTHTYMLQVCVQMIDVERPRNVFRFHGDVLLHLEHIKENKNKKVTLQ